MNDWNSPAAVTPKLQFGRGCELIASNSPDRRGTCLMCSVSKTARLTKYSCGRTGRSGRICQSRAAAAPQ